mgnify:CR=1 FL=1
MLTDNLPSSSDRFRLGLASRHEEMVGVHGGLVKGEVFMELRDGNSGELLDERHIDNLILLDAGILIQMLLRDPTSRPAGGINMLAVGTGATGALLSPDAPDPLQRKLNAEIQRKGFVSTTFRSAAGAAVAYPTNVCDYTTTFAEAEAVGPLNEMSLISAFSANTAVQNLNPNAFPTRDVTVDVSALDVEVNRLTFSVLTKPSTAVLTITWRLTS